MNAGRPIHFISGLPRAGSTLLAAILRQNPALHAGMSSPLASLVMAMQRAMSQENEGASFIDDARREAVLRGVVAGYYEGLPAGVTAVDTNRAWCAKLPLLARLYPSCRVIACVRDVGQIMESFERMVHANALEPSQIYGFDPGGTAFSRTAGLAGSAGLVGFALDALREAVFGPEARRLLLLTYETLTAEPARAVAAVYDFLALPTFAHDFTDVRYDEGEDFDRRLGAPGLHRVGRRVEMRHRDAVLPPSLLSQFAGDSFWLASPNPRGVAVI